MRQKLLLFIVSLLGFCDIQSKAQTDSKCNLEINKSCESTRSQNDTIKWYSFNEGHSIAVRENKILMINVSTDWCYPCKLMNKHTYTHRGVIDTLNKYFVCVYLNPDIESSYLLKGNKVTSKELIKYLYVDEQVAYPTSLFWLHPESEEKHCVHSGFMKPPIYLKLLTAARAARPISWLGVSLKLDNGEP
jgi:thiol:disulfide interchange protein